MEDASPDDEDPLFYICQKVYSEFMALSSAPATRRLHDLIRDLTGPPAAAPPPPPPKDEKARCSNAACKGFVASKVQYITVDKKQQATPFCPKHTREFKKATGNDASSRDLAEACA